MKFGRLRSLAAASAVLGAFALTPAVAGPLVFQLDTSKLGGFGGPTNTFTADRIVLSSVSANIALTDSDFNGVLGNGTSGVFSDAFNELGSVALVSFQKGAVVVPTIVSGDGVNYELFATYNLQGFAGVSNVTDAKAVLTVATGTLFLDPVVDGVLSGGAINIATFGAPPGGGDCVQTGATNFTQGSCKFQAQFNAAAGTGGAIWSISGLDMFGQTGFSTILNINIDNATGLTLPVYPGGPGSTQNFTVTHRGSAILVVPEPASLALVGLALILAGGIARRKSR